MSAPYAFGSGWTYGNFIKDVLLIKHWIIIPDGKCSHYEHSHEEGYT